MGIEIEDVVETLAGGKQWGSSRNIERRVCDVDVPALALYPGDTSLDAT